MNELEIRKSGTATLFLISMAVFLLCSIIVVVLNLPFINMPPVWDATAGTFAPAIYLFESSFDFSSLLEQEGYLYGGPNVHSFSLITLITYFIISIANGDPVLFLPALHFIQFMFAGVVLTCTFIMARKIFGLFIALAVTSALLFYPLFLVQTGYLYMEVPGAALVIFSLLSWVNRNYALAILLGLASCMVKSFGITLMFSLSVLFLLDETIPKHRKLVWISIMIIFTLGIEMVKWNPLVTRPPAQTNYFSYLRSVFRYLNLVPDLKFMFFTNLFFPFFFIVKHRAYTPGIIIKVLSDLIRGGVSQRILVSSFLFSFVFIGFILTVPLSSRYFLPLLRYYVWVLPLMFINTCFVFKLLLASILRLCGWFNFRNIDISLITIFISLTVFFMINRDGEFYPSLGASKNSFSAVERTYEYLDYFKIQQESVNTLSRVQGNTTAFVTRGEYYFLSSPLMGYVKGNPSNIFFVLKEPYRAAMLSDFPADFILLDIPSNRSHGSTVIKELLNKARLNPDYSVTELANHSSGPYSSSILRISKKKK